MPRQSVLKSAIIQYSTEHPEATSIEVGHAVGARPGYVRVVWQRMACGPRKRGRPISAFRPGLFRRICFSEKDLVYFTHAAAQRGMSVHELLCDLVSAIARDDLVKAILDD